MHDAPCLKPFRYTSNGKEELEKDELFLMLKPSLRLLFFHFTFFAVDESGEVFT